MRTAEKINLQEAEPTSPQALKGQQNKQPKNKKTY